jgi:hypothetical protein
VAAFSAAVAMALMSHVVGVATLARSHPPAPSSATIPESSCCP